MKDIQPPKVNVRLDQTTPIVCEKCQCQAFQEGLLLRKVSKFISMTAQDGLLPVQTFFCVACGHVNEEFLPKELNA
jgi:hypothetical protein